MKIDKEIVEIFIDGSKSSLIKINNQLSRCEYKYILLRKRKINIDCDSALIMKSVVDLVDRHALIALLPVNKDVLNESDYILCDTIYSDVMLLRMDVLRFFGGLPENCVDVYNSVIEYQNKIKGYGFTGVGILCKTITNFNYFIDTKQISKPLLDKIMDRNGGKKKILFDIYNLPGYYNGSAIYATSLLESLYKQYKYKYDIDILVSKDGDEKFDIRNKYDNVLFMEDVNEVYDIAVVPSQIFELSHLEFLNKYTLKYVFSMQDIISLRCGYLGRHSKGIEDIFRCAIKMSDGIVSISEFVENDIKSYFCGEKFPKIKIIHHGINKKASVDYSYDLPFEHYVLVIGNKMKHKMLLEFEQLAVKSQFKYIFIGAKSTERISDNIYGFSSGDLSSTFIDYLHRKCEMIIFPSIYEGFGLPVIESIKYCKNILLLNTQLNRELKDSLGCRSKNIWLVDNFFDLDACILDVKNNIVDIDDIMIRTWMDVAEETEGFISDIIQQPLDIKKIIYRNNQCLFFQRIPLLIMKEYFKNKINNKKLLFLKRLLKI